MPGADQVAEVLAHRVGRALVPILHAAVLGQRLLGGQDFDKAAAEVVEAIRAANVLVQAHRLKLREHVDLVDAAVEAVGERDVDQAVLAGQRHRRLGAVRGERLQSSAATTTQTLTATTRCTVQNLSTKAGYNQPLIDKIDQPARHHDGLDHCLPASNSTTRSSARAAASSVAVSASAATATFDRSLPFICTGISIVSSRAAPGQTPATLVGQRVADGPVPATILRPCGVRTARATARTAPAPPAAAPIAS